MERSVAIVMSRCSGSKEGFGIRIERNSIKQWILTWAFAIKESIGKREGYGKSSISGPFVLAPTYSGCPHCQACSIFLCGCGKVACWNGERRSVTCPWCGLGGELSGEIKSLDAGTDR